MDGGSDAGLGHARRGLAFDRLSNLDRPIKRALPRAMRGLAAEQRRPAHCLFAALHVQVLESMILLEGQGTVKLCLAWVSIVWYAILGSLGLLGCRAAYVSHPIVSR